MKNFVKTLICQATVIVCLFILPLNSYAMSGKDNLGTWRTSSIEERAKLSLTMIRKVGEGKITETQIKVLAMQVFQCINGTAGDGGFDFMKISETASGCIVILADK